MPVVGKWKSEEKVMATEQGTVTHLMMMAVAHPVISERAWRTR